MKRDVVRKNVKNDFILIKNSFVGFVKLELRKNSTDKKSKYLFNIAIFGHLRLEIIAEVTKIPKITVLVTSLLAFRLLQDFNIERTKQKNLRHLRMILANTRAIPCSSLPMV